MNVIFICDTDLDVNAWLPQDTHTHTKWHRHFQMPKMNKYAFNKQNEMSQSNIVATRGNGSKKRKRKQQILNFKQTTLIWCVFFPLDCRRIGWVIDVCHAKHISGSEHENVKLLSKYIYQFRADDAQPFDLVFTRCNWKKICSKWLHRAWEDEILNWIQFKFKSMTWNAHNHKWFKDVELLLVAAAVATLWISLKTISHTKIRQS